METCLLTIITVTDGKKSEVTKRGQCLLSPTLTQIEYEEENARVSVRFEKGEAHVLREGDYTLSLPLKKGTKTLGEIGINGAIGNVEIETSRIAYSQRENDFTLSLRYSLWLGTERQNMSIRLLVKKEKGEKQ